MLNFNRLKTIDSNNNSQSFLAKKARNRLIFITDKDNIFSKMKIESLPDYNKNTEERLSKSRVLKYIFQRPYSYTIRNLDGSIKRDPTNASKILLLIAKSYGIEKDTIVEHMKRNYNFSDVQSVLADAATLMLIYCNKGNYFYITNTGISYIKDVMGVENIEDDIKIFYNWESDKLTMNTKNNLDELPSSPTTAVLNGDERKSLDELREKKEQALKNLMAFDASADAQLNRALELLINTKKMLDEDRKTLYSAYRNALHEEANFIRKSRNLSNKSAAYQNDELDTLLEKIKDVFNSLTH